MKVPKLNIALVEPFFGGSHKQWATQLKKYSHHHIHLYTLPARFWKWRMHGAAIHLAKKVNESSTKIDLIIVTDMLNLPVFKSLLVHANTPIVIYFHENQITYPWSKEDKDLIEKRDVHYGFINISSALSATKVLFNSQYHLNRFVKAIPQFLKKFPDYNELWVHKAIKNKSEVIPIGIDFSEILSCKPLKKKQNKIPIILWNHRWEYDKNPKDFFTVLDHLKQKNIRFKLYVLGEKAKNYPSIFNDAKIFFSKEILHWGYVKNRKEYLQMLWQADILPVCAIQDFFGISVVEAMACECYPLLPNRLAYVEHIDKKQFERCMYETKEDLVNKMQKLIFEEEVNYLNYTNKKITTYSWIKIARLFDTTFEKIVYYE